ncbi:MAG: TIR domain-containing protein, partial [Okeania sp. SIO3I5]|uniref:toll/interleukin-1 receptor domain-containing protein n=1 Tax=Okeania sp. SIO3I5 TaxID=2607805 RepID=UPI0013BB8324
MNEAPLSYKYDLFISYAEANRDWVKGFLLPPLDSAEVKYVEPENLSPGVPFIQELELFVRESKYVLLIISDAYLIDDLNKFTDILAQSHGIENRDWSVIPLLLEQVQLPQMPSRLKMLTPLDATDETKWQPAVDRLCKYLNRPVLEPPPKPECPYPGIKTFE